jgi:hypothetical protein
MRTLIGLLAMGGGLLWYGLPMELWVAWGGYVLWTIGDAQGGRVRQLLQGTRRLRF